PPSRACTRFGRARRSGRGRLLMPRHVVPSPAWRAFLLLASLVLAAPCAPAAEATPSATQAEMEALRARLKAAEQRLAQLADVADRLALLEGRGNAAPAALPASN